MLPIGVWLLAAGIGAAMLRARAGEPRVIGPKRDHLEGEKLVEHATVDSTFDDVTELRHYKRVSAYAFAFGLSGYWFLPLASIIALPLNGYGVWNYVRVLKHTKPADRISAMSLFESIGVIGSTLTGHAVVASLVMLTGFSVRKVMIYIGNITYNYSSEDLKLLRQKEVWALREGVELLLPVSALKSSDRIVVKEGDVIPLSGKVVEGSGRVIQFSLEKRMKLINKIVPNQVHPLTKLESGNLLIKPNLPYQK